MSKSRDIHGSRGQSQVGPTSEDRRRFLKTASKVAVTAPAVTLLLSASTLPRQAHAKMYHNNPPPWPL